MWEQIADDYQFSNHSTGYGWKRVVGYPDYISHCEYPYPVPLDKLITCVHELMVYRLLGEADSAGENAKYVSHR